MENQSQTPPAVPNGQVQTLETNPSNPASNGGESVKEEVAHESSGRPPFAIPQPMREEQVQNAVKFLSHPKVKGSPVIYRRSFLERKGLTKEEIDEAFRRVPDQTPSNAAIAEATTTNQTNHVSQPGSSKAIQLQAPIQTLQPAAGGASTATILQQSRFHWKHALVAIGALAASGAGTAVLFKKMVLPGLKSWVRKVVEEDKESKEVDKESKEVDKLKTSLAEETVEAAKATASAAAIMAKASQELVNAKTEERKRHELLMELMDMQVKEMKSMSKTIHGLETRKKSGRQEDKLMGDYSTRNGTTNNSWMNSQVDYTDATFSSVFPKQGNGTLDVDSGAVRPTSAPASAEPLAPPPHPKSYMEIMSMIQRGEKPPGIKEINDMPPNPNQPPSKPVLAPRPKPWEIPQQTQQAPIYGHQYQSDNDPAISEVQDNSQPSQHNGKMHYASEPFWGKKTVKITEIESEADGPRKSSSLPPQRAWIPPQPPAVVMPEAAAAIRQPRSSAQKQLATNDDDVSMASSEGIENETVKTTESIVELKYPSSASMDLNQSEIQEESVNTVEV